MTPDEKVIQLILEMQQRAGPDEEPVTEAEWQEHLKLLYDAYAKLAEKPGAIRVPYGYKSKTQAISEETKTKFAVAMMNSIGKEWGERPQNMRNYVRGLFSKERKGSPSYIDTEATFPVQWHEEFGPEIDTLGIKNEYELNGHDSAMQVGRMLIPDYKTDGATMYGERGDLDTNADRRIETALSNLLSSFDKESMMATFNQYEPGRIPTMGETVAVMATPEGSRYDPVELFGEKNLQLDYPDVLDKDFHKKIAEFEDGKAAQLDYFKGNDPMYKLLGSGAQQVFNQTETRLRDQYDLERALGTYKDPYVNYLQDYGSGKVKPWSEQQWGVAMTNIQGLEGFGNWMGDRQGPDSVFRTEETQTTEEAKNLLKLQHAIIGNRDQVLGWILNKEMAQLDPSIRHYKQPALLKDLNNFIMQNMGKELSILADPAEQQNWEGASKTIGRKTFKEWQDRSFNWTQTVNPETRFKEYTPYKEKQSTVFRSKL